MNWLLAQLVRYRPLYPGFAARDGHACRSLPVASAGAAGPVGQAAPVICHLPVGYDTQVKIIEERYGRDTAAFAAGMQKAGRALASLFTLVQEHFQQRQERSEKSEDRP